MSKWKVAEKTRALIISALESAPLNYREIVEITGVCRFTAINCINQLREEKLVRIAFFERCSTGKESIMVFELGSGPDAKRKPMTATERQRRYRQKKSRAGLKGFLYGTKETRHAQ